MHISDTAKLPPAFTGCISEISQTQHGIRVKRHSKTHALDSLGKYHGLFVSRHEVKANVTGSRERRRQRP